MKSTELYLDPELDKKFGILQKGFISQYEQVFNDRLAPHSVVIIPSLTLDQQILSKIKGHFFYEERLLCLLIDRKSVV